MAKNLAAEEAAGSSGILTIDSGALRHNYKILQDLAHGAEVAAVVKADAYGLGAAVVAAALYDAGCRLFFVAQLAEAFALRAVLAGKIAQRGNSANGHGARSGHKSAASRALSAGGCTIAILNDVLPHEAKRAAQAGFLPVLNSIDSVRFWADLCRAERKALPAMLQCDSGMARLGLDKDEVRALQLQPEILAAMKIQAILSHLACGDDEKSAMNAAQRKRFLAEAKILIKVLGYRPRLSLAASDGLNLGKNFCLDIVRPGMALYGIAENGGGKKEKQALRPVVSLEGRIMRIGCLHKGDTVGYGAAYKAGKTMPTAVVAVGYADGWPRCLGNKGAVFYKGVRLPIAGRISMDCMVVDLSPLGAAPLPKRGEFVELIGAHQTAQTVAEQAGTIAYEIFTSFGRRYLRRIISADSGKRKAVHYV